MLLNGESQHINVSQPAKLNAWSPLRQRVFRALWIASVISNIGTWMQSTATAWLMTTLAPSAVMVSLVQTATSLPIFLLALPAGALADMMDRRRLILLTQVWMLLAAALLAVLTLAGQMTPWVLLALTLLLALGMAMNAPAWQTVIPEMVHPSEIPAAVALNSAGFNLARFIGPAIGGLVVGLAGAGAAYLCNAVSYLGVIYVVLSWNSGPREETTRDPHILRGIESGLRYVFLSEPLRAILLQAACFVLCASAQMALLPLWARQTLGVDSTGYGFLVGAFGLGAVAGALVLPLIRRRMSLENVARVSTLAFAVNLAGMALVDWYSCAVVGLFVGGVGWLMLLSSFNGSVQLVVPAWVRGRAMAVYLLIFFGGMALGSFIWGAVANGAGMQRALLLAAVGLVLGPVAGLWFPLPPEDSQP
jgi:MFS family permease